MDLIYKCSVFIQHLIRFNKYKNFYIANLKIIIFDYFNEYFIFLSIFIKNSVNIIIFH